MKARLNQPNSGGPAFVCAIHHRLHKLAANPAVLCTGVNGDWARPSNHGPFVKDITANEPATAFCNHAIDTGAREQPGKQARRSFGSRKVARKTVGRADR